MLGTVSAFAYRHRETEKNLCARWPVCIKIKTPGYKIQNELIFLSIWLPTTRPLQSHFQSDKSRQFLDRLCHCIMLKIDRLLKRLFVQWLGGWLIFGRGGLSSVSWHYWWFDIPWKSVLTCFVAGNWLLSKDKTHFQPQHEPLPPLKLTHRRNWINPF